MLRLLLVIVPACALIACSEEAPPKPAPKPAAEAPAAPITAPPPPPPAPAAKAEPPAPDPNKELADRVKRALEGEAKIQAAGIDVTAKDGTVTLWGTTTTAAEKNRAAQAARKVDGVKVVENKLAVVKGS
ncbi:MAG TPA: BON domain-containing protein [Burkholderiales bacterium]|nr:BON domain-containing protein [Burkholderiales bacterium]